MADEKGFKYVKYKNRHGDINYYIYYSIESAVHSDDEDLHDTEY